MDLENPTPLIDFERLGQRLAQLRDAHNWTLDELSARSGMSVSYLSRIEHGSRQPSLETLSVLAQVFGVPLSVLFEEDDIPCAVIRGDDAPVRMGNDLTYTLLSRRGQHMTMQAIRVTVPPQGIKTYSHAGEEWIYVLSGQLELTYNDEHHTLNAGDSAHFSAYIEHQFSGSLEQITEVLIVASVAKHPLLSSYL